MQAKVEVAYGDLTTSEVIEEESYPLNEMINELVGVFTIYFGFSVLSLVSWFEALKNYLTRSGRKSQGLAKLFFYRNSSKIFLGL